MKTWMKVAIGCVAVGVIGLFLFVAGIIGLSYWGKNKFQEMTNGGAEAEEARRVANAIPFTRPTGGIVSEPRLVKFIEARAAVYSVYEKYRGEIEARAKKVKDGQSLDFSDISTGITFVNELQKAEMLALAKYKMPEAEYEFIAGEVYKAMWTDLGNENAGKAAMENAARATEAAAEAMKKGAADLPPEAREGLARASEEIAKSSDQVKEGLKELRTAPENVALFTKYEAELKKYAMPGLQILFDEKGNLQTTERPKR